MEGGGGEVQSVGGGGGGGGGVVAGFEDGERTLDKAQGTGD